MHASRSLVFAAGVIALAAVFATDPPASSAADQKETRFTRAVIDCPATRVHAKGTGEVRRVLAEEGSVVKAGDVLAELQDAELEAELKLAEAEVALAMATVKEFMAGKTQAQLAASPAKETLARLEAQVKVAEARLRVAQVRVAGLVVISPLAGTVGKRAVEPGNYVRKGAELFTVYDLTKPEAVVQVPEKDVAAVRKGQKCTVRIDAIPDLKLAGEVDRIEPIVADAPGRRVVRVYVAVQNPKDERKYLRPGMTGEVAFDKPE